MSFNVAYKGLKRFGFSELSLNNVAFKINYKKNYFILDTVFLVWKIV